MQGYIYRNGREYRLVDSSSDIDHLRPTLALWKMAGVKGLIVKSGIRYGLYREKPKGGL